MKTASVEKNKTSRNNNSFYRVLVNRLNSRAFAMAAAFLLISVGLAFTLFGISGAGTIDLSTPFMEGRLESGSTGLLFVFLGTLIVIGALSLKKKSILKIKRGDVELTYEGYISGDRIEKIQRVLAVHSADMITEVPNDDTPKSATADRAIG